MENQNVKEFRQIAKERKIKYYYKMRRDELISALIEEARGSAIVAPATVVHTGPATVVHTGPATVVPPAATGWFSSLRTKAVRKKPSIQL